MGCSPRGLGRGALVRGVEGTMEVLELGRCSGPAWDVGAGTEDDDVEAAADGADSLLLLSEGLGGTESFRWYASEELARGSMSRRFGLISCRNYKEKRCTVEVTGKIYPVHVVLQKALQILK